MKALALTHGKVAIVDPSDYAGLAKYRWRADCCGGRWYAVRSNAAGLRPRKIYLHREIMSPASGLSVDHINGDPLDNRRINLRVCTHQHNIFNSRRKIRGSSRFTGVGWHKASRKWMARIKVSYKNLYLGVFESEEAAGRARDAAAVRYFGEFAVLNFSDKPLD